MSSIPLHLIAAAMHENYQREAAEKGWPVKPDVDKPYNQLSTDFQEANLTAARRIPEVLALISVKILTASQATVTPLGENALRELIDQDIERLAIAEHEGWMRQRAESGWKYAEKRDDAQKLHPSIVAYGQLTETEKEKDRNQVRSYPALLKQAGFVSVVQK